MIQFVTDFAEALYHVNSANYAALFRKLWLLLASVDSQKPSKDE